MVQDAPGFKHWNRPLTRAVQAVVRRATRIGYVDVPEGIVVHRQLIHGFDHGARGAVDGMGRWTNLYEGVPLVVSSKRTKPLDNLFHRLGRTSAAPFRIEPSSTHDETDSDVRCGADHCM